MNKRQQASFHQLLTIIRYEENVGRLLARRSHTIKLPRPTRTKVGAAFLARCSMSDGRLFSIEITTAAIFAVLIYPVVVPRYVSSSTAFFTTLSILAFFSGDSLAAGVL
jgi:hypothetical protein